MKKSIIFFLSLLWSVSNTFGQMIYVNAANTSGIEDGTEQHPFNTIKEGINAATAGNTVVIQSGDYYPEDSWSGNDHTLFLKAGVRLLGSGIYSPRINGNVVDQEVSNLSIEIDSLGFDEFHFARGTIAGPFDGRNIIRNCWTNLISLPFGAGIPLNDTTPGPNYGFLIENNSLGSDGIIEFKQGAGVSELSVLNNSCGYIYIKSGAGYTYLIDKNDVFYGIFDKSSANTTTISNNHIYNGLISDLSGGLGGETENEIIVNNTIKANENSPAFADEEYKAGIIAKSSSVTIRNNTITCTGNVSGIRSSAGAPMHIIDNIITLDEVSQPNPDPYEGTIGIFNYSGWGYVKGNVIHGGNLGYFSKAGTVEFANNDIMNSYTGFYSMGAEVVHHNNIQNCKGDGMILNGVKGPVFNNNITNNAGSGIRVIRTPIDLGGGANNGYGNNVLMQNGNYDLYIETSSEQYPVLYAKFNVWDHDNADQISQLDIRDGRDSTGLVTVDFTPWGGLGIEEPDNSGVVICPNPVRDKFTMQNVKCHMQECRIELVDLYGKVVAECVWETGSEVMEIDVSHLSPGIYFVRIDTDDKYVVKKLIKQ